MSAARRKPPVDSEINKVRYTTAGIYTLDWQPGNGTRYEFLAICRELNWYVALVNFNMKFVAVQQFSETGRTYPEAGEIAEEIGFRDLDDGTCKVGKVDLAAITEGLCELFRTMGKHEAD